MQPITHMQGRVYVSMRRRKIMEKPEEQANFEKAMLTVPTKSIGPFWCYQGTTLCINETVVHVGLQKREEGELRELLQSGFLTESFLCDVLVPLNDESSAVPRLRLYNWYCTNFGKFKGASLQTRDPVTGAQRFIDPTISYCATLKRLHRTLFDPYRRGTLLFFKVGDVVHHTTVGQLLFLKWCKKNEVDKWVTVHETEIREHLEQSCADRALRGKKRVRELTERQSATVRLLGE
jgi:hypothetical protein